MNKVITVSLAALLASTSAVLAQQGGERGGNAGANAPTAGSPNSGSSGSAPSAREQAPGQMKEPGTSARDEAPGQTKEPGTSARDEAPGRNKDANDRGANTRDNRSDSGDRGSDRKADRDSNDGKSSGDKADRADRKDNKEVRNVTIEQKTKVKTVFQRHRVEPARNINFSLNVGVNVPRDVRFYSIPRDILVIVPQYEEYRYFIVDDKVVIVDPDSYAIVDVIIIA
jgi:hypothetical protein